MTVTGLYIVKNEAQEIKRSVQSISAACDEIVVIDTGSTDNTIGIVTALGAKVFHFDWVNDFSKARNFALTKAEGDLVIFLDADEWFTEPLTKKDREFLLGKVSEGYRLFSVYRRNINGNVLTNPIYNTRMLIGHGKLKYLGAIHEYVDDTDRNCYLPERFMLLHSGYDGARSQEKVERNIKLLYTQLESEKDKRRRLALYYYTARETGLMQKIQEQLKYLKMFFALWGKMEKKLRPANFGIGAYKMITDVCEQASQLDISNDEYAGYCDAFVREFPDHPAALLALAGYHYTRHSDYISAMSALTRMDAAAEKYDINDYPHDFVGIESARSYASMIKGNILYDYGEKDKAFDCYASLLSNIDPSADFLRRLINIIRDQPTNDIVAFLSAIPKQADAAYYELLLSQLVFFPSLKDVYMYFAVQHIKVTKQHSDITALTTLFSEGSCEHLVNVAKAAYETDSLSCGVLLMLAAMFSDDPGIRKSFPSFPRIDRILDSYYKGDPIETLDSIDLGFVGRAAQMILFIDRKSVNEKFNRLLSSFQFLRGYILSHYYIRSEEYGRMLESIDMDYSALSPDNRAEYFVILGTAYTSVKDFDNALFYLQEAYTLSPGNVKIYKALNVLASVAPRLEKLITPLTENHKNLYRQFMQDQSVAAIDAVFSGNNSNN